MGLSRFESGFRFLLRGGGAFAGQSVYFSGEKRLVNFTDFLFPSNSGLGGLGEIHLPSKSDGTRWVVRIGRKFAGILLVILF